MAGRFPLAYSTETNYGGTGNNPNKNVNPYYYIHTSSNASIFTQESPALFDVYTFVEDPDNASDSPRVSYSLVVIKNMGASASHVSLSEATLTMSTVNESVSQDDNPFSFVNNLNQIHDESFSSVGVLTPDEFDLVTGPNGETNHGLSENKPLGYLKLDISSGNVNEGSFDGTGAKYIPFYRVDQDFSDAANTAGGISLTDFTDSFDANNTTVNAIGAKNISNVVYPEYAAFIIKCRPEINMDTEGGILTLIFSEPATTITINLYVTAYRRGYLAYEQGWWNYGNDPASFQALNGELGSIAATKKSGITNTSSTNSPIINWQTPSTLPGMPDNVSLNFPITDMPPSGEDFGGLQFFNLIDFPTDDSIILNATVCRGFYPIGYSESSSQNHIVNPQSTNTIAYHRYIVRVYDSTVYQGGIRFIHGDEVKPNQNFYTMENNIDNNYFVFTDFPDDATSDVMYEDTGDAPLGYYKTLGESPEVGADDGTANTPSLEFSQQLLGSDGLTNVQFYTMQGSKEIYIKIAPILAYHEDKYYRVGDNSDAIKLHPNTGNHFSSNSSRKNRRVNITGIPVFYNPFWISEAAAADGVNGEEVYRDTLYFSSGNYYIWSTNVDTLNKFGRMDNIDNLTGTSAAFGVLERFSEKRVTENIFGAELIPGVYNVSNFKESSLDPSVNFANTNNVTGNFNSAQTRIWRHKHIYDFFNIHKFGADIISPFMELQFNNISGNDNFYCADFRWVSQDDSIPNTYLNTPGGDPQSFDGVVFSNSNFKPHSIADWAGNNSVSNESALTVFAKNSVICGSFDELSGDSYVAGAKKKTTQIKIEYNGGLPVSSYTEDFVSWNGRSAPEDTGDDSNFDAIGRYTEANELQFNPFVINAATGLGGATQQYVGNMPTTLKLYNHANKWYPIWRGFEIGNLNAASGVTDAILNSANFNANPFVKKTLYITSYCGTNKFGVHGVSSSDIVDGLETGLNRMTYSIDHVQAASQRTLISTSYNSTPSSSQHNLTLSGGISGTGLSGSRVTFASTDENDDYYYRKYPLNGPSCYKYERYFKDRVLHTQTTADGQNNNTEPYGILPGPICEGRINSSGHQYSLKAVNGTFNEEAFEPSKFVMFGHASYLNQNNNTYELSMPFNFQNSNYEGAQIISIDLENRVGSAGSTLYSQNKRFGDPRYINGDRQKGLYKTALHIKQQDMNWSAPHLGFGQTAQMSLEGDITNGYEFTYAANATDNPSHIYVIPKMKVTGVGIPENTFAHVHSGTVLHLKDGIADNASNVTATNATDITITLDYPKPNYVIWDIIAHPNTPSSVESLYEANIVSTDQGTGNVVKLRSLNQDIADGSEWLSGSNYTEQEADAYNGYPEEKFINNEMVQLQAGGTSLNLDVVTNAVTLGFANSVGTFDVGVFSTMGANSQNDNKSLYNRYQQVGNYYFYDTANEQVGTQHLGVPCVYFAIDNSALGMIDAQTSSDYNNEIDSGTYINRLRIRYILHSKLEAYGVNQKRLTGSTQNGINYTSSNLDEVHVHEDTYLIAVNFTNKTPEIRIVDVEGEERVNDSVLDFGTMQIG